MSISFLCKLISGVPLILAILIPLYNTHNKTTKECVNHDTLMRSFVYKLYLPYSEIIERLQICSDADELTCTIDTAQGIMNFKEYGSERKYRFEIQQFSDHSILFLSQLELIGTSSHIPFKLNPFFIKKLDAEIIPFYQT